MNFTKLNRLVERTGRIFQITKDEQIWALHCRAYNLLLSKGELWPSLNADIKRKGLR